MVDILIDYIDINEVGEEDEYEENVVKEVEDANDADVEEGGTEKPIPSFERKNSFKVILNDSKHVPVNGGVIVVETEGGRFHTGTCSVDSGSRVYEVCCSHGDGVICIGHEDIAGWAYLKDVIYG